MKEERYEGVSTSVELAVENEIRGFNIWFHDIMDFAPGCRFSFKVKEVLCHYRSKYQDIAIFDTEQLGRVLVLDNITMTTEFDEFAYHEMIAHVPLLTHPNPRRVLIVGGGDGGTAREVLKHPEVEELYVCELDEEVVNACKRHLPSLASSFDDKRVRLFFEDGAKFVKNYKDFFDVILVDSTDPIGPGMVLFQREFYKDMYNALTQDGIVASQMESVYLHLKVIREVLNFSREIYPVVSYYKTLVPTYPSGIIGFAFCSKKYRPEEFSLKRDQRLKDLRYYTPQMHKFSFCMPKFCAHLLGDVPEFK